METFQGFPKKRRIKKIKEQKSGKTNCKDLLNKKFGLFQEKKIKTILIRNRAPPE